MHIFSCTLPIIKLNNKLDNEIRAEFEKEQKGSKFSTFRK
jgi:hypothetical protein